MANVTNLRQESHGKTIKQGDTASEFVFSLHKGLREGAESLEGQQAIIRLSDGEVSVYRTTSEVTDGKVRFTIDNPLPVGLYQLEIEAGGHIFPSDNSIVIEISKGTTLYEFKELVPLDVQELGAKLAEISELVDKVKDFSEYDDADIKSEIKEVSNALDALKSSYEELSNKPDASFDDSVIMTKLSDLESKLGTLGQSMLQSDSKLSTVESDIENLEGSLSALDRNTSSSISELYSSLSNLSTKFSDYATLQELNQAIGSARALFSRYTTPSDVQGIVDDKLSGKRDKSDVSTITFTKTLARPPIVSYDSEKDAYTIDFLDYSSTIQEWIAVPHRKVLSVEQDVNAIKADYLKKGDISTDGLLSKTEADSTYAKKGDIQNVNTDIFLTKEDADGLYAKSGEIHQVDTTGLLTKEEAEETYAKKDDIPDVDTSTLLTKTEADSTYTKIGTLPAVGMYNAGDIAEVSYQGEGASRRYLFNFTKLKGQLDALNNKLEQVTGQVDVPVTVTTTSANGLTARGNNGTGNVNQGWNIGNYDVTSFKEGDVIKLIAALYVTGDKGGTIGIQSEGDVTAWTAGSYVSYEEVFNITPSTVWLPVSRTFIFKKEYEANNIMRFRFRLDNVPTGCNIKVASFRAVKITGANGFF